MTKQYINPCNYEIAAIIPNWLMQIPMSHLSANSKILYSRLCAWAYKNGTCYRSVPKLAKEIGCSPRSCDRYIKELKDFGLIETYLNQEGGQNNYRFLKHELMDTEIIPELTRDQKKSPHDKSDAPPTSDLPPPHDKSDVHNIKEYKNINIMITESGQKMASEDELFFLCCFLESYNLYCPTHDIKSLTSKHIKAIRIFLDWLKSKGIEYKPEVLKELMESYEDKAHYWLRAGDYNSERSNPKLCALLKPANIKKMLNDNFDSFYKQE
jgi:hypothetical protein